MDEGELYIPRAPGWWKRVATPPNTWACTFSLRLISLHTKGFRQIQAEDAHLRSNPQLISDKMQALFGAVPSHPRPTPPPHILFRAT